jgi:arylsulfatase A-like enzyme
MAFRMQVSATDAFDLSQEPAAVREMYGVEPGRESLANNCLLARRLIERGVRYVQLFDWGWDSHGASASEALNGGFKDKCTRLDRPAAALIKDLKQRGLLDETLIVWTGEFGRTSMQENRGGNKMAFIGRDHNPGAFTLWMAGGGARPGTAYGETDEMGYRSVINPVSVHDIHATMLALLGFDHLRLTYPFRGVNQRLTNVTAPGSRVVSELII